MTQLLNDNGTASVATAVMMSHHAFRRDLAQLAMVLAQPALGDERITAIADEWRSLHQALHGHHHSEDVAIFPDLRAKHPELASSIDRLTADHRRIDPILERGDHAFAQLPLTLDDARAVVRELTSLLDTHLAFEEETVIPHLRSLREFPPVTTDDEAQMYADGFAWATYGIAPAVLEQVNAMLQPPVLSRLPAARIEFEARWLRAWGVPLEGSSTTSVPGRLP